ncbi:MAG: hypothetical protein ABFD92_03790 [Planctomycetaceae bacterium]|nr:hypothetical protein [Planctomycetaceae bacterium]
MKSEAIRAAPWLILVILLAIGGCDDSETKRERQRQQEVARMQESTDQERQDLNKQIQKAHQETQQDRRVLVAQKELAEQDRSTAVFLWICSSTALLVLVLLFAREHHLRRILEKLIRMLLHSPSGDKP